MTYPREQFITGIDPEENATRTVATCAGCGCQRSLLADKALHQQLDGGPRRYVLVPPWGWLCYECFLRVQTAE